MSYEDELAKRLEETFAPALIPEIGRIYILSVRRMSTRTTENGPYPICTGIQIREGKVVPSDSPSGEWAWHMMGTALANAVERDFPDPGDIVVFRYKGKETAAKSGREFHAYDYKVDRNPPEQYRKLVDDHMAHAAEAEAALDEPF
jgi:hypothetical protein